MSAGLQLGIEQLAVHTEFEFTAVRGDQGDGFDLVFKLFQQFDRHTDGFIGIVSNLAVDQLDLHHGEIPPS